MITVFTKKRSGYRRQRLFLITIVMILLLFILYGYTSVFTLYLYGHPFCLDALNVAFISLAQALTVSIISLLIVFWKKTVDKTYLLPILGSITLIIGLTVFSVAKRVWLLYIGMRISFDLKIFIKNNFLSCLCWKFIFYFFTYSSNKTDKTSRNK